MKGRGAWGEGHGWRLAVLLGCLIAGGASAAPVVLSVDRIYRSDQSDRTGLVEAGEILLTELRCVNCHAPPPDLAARIPVAPAPDLRNVTSRLRRDHLRNWLADPHQTKPGTRMPDLLATYSKKSRASKAEALHEFLLSLGSEKVAETTMPWNEERGRELFHSIGCVACHQPRVDFTKTAAGELVDAADVKSPSVPLDRLGEKYTRHGLKTFLRDPHAVRPSGRMPRFELNETELNDLTGYLLSDRGESKDRSGAGQLRFVDAGKRIFSDLGCASCHEIKSEGKAVSSRAKAKPLHFLIGRVGGCLSEEPSKSTPWYGLDDFQRRALTSALLNLRNKSPLRPIDLNHRRMVMLNCYACHQRNKVGGPEEARLKYFTCSASDLGDEGRVPPILTGVGRKLQPSAMEQIIQAKMPARPYMLTRMPDFGAEHAKFLSAGFAKADHDPNEKPTPRNGEENQVGRNMWGRALLGTKGLSCITCHQLNGRKSLGIQAMDLAHSAGRLRPAWFRDYLINPAKFRPGTRMPSFWPEGKPIIKSNGGKTERQIDSIWVYLNELDQSRLPEGLEKTGDFLLKPTDQPIVFRTFMEHAGMHAVAVGFPASTHAAFDAQNPRWAIAWTGKFLDAESTWDDRFTPLAKPQGENVIPIQPNPPRHEKNNVSRFKGYQLHLESGHPIFHYQVGGEDFTDTMLPTASGGKRMARTLTKKTGRTPKWIEIANGKTILKQGAHWIVDQRLKVTTSAAARVITTATGNHLQAEAKDQVVVAYQW